MTKQVTKIDKKLEKLIDLIIMELNPMALDDDISDLLDNLNNRENAIVLLQTKLKGLLC